MKRLFIAVATLMFSFSAFAQDLTEGAQAKNAGNEAYRNKEFVKAIESWDKYLKSGEEGVEDDLNTKELFVSSHKFAADDFLSKDDNTNAVKYYKMYFEKGGDDAKKDEKSIFNTAMAARKLKDYPTAMEYFQKSDELNYRGDVSLYYVAVIHKELNNEDRMREVLEKALVKYPDSRFRQNMVNLITIPLLKEAAVPFNEANNLARAAGSGDPTAYVDNMSKAVSKFEETIPLLNKILEIDPNNDNAHKYLDACNQNIKDFNDYKASLEKK